MTKKFKKAIVSFMLVACAASGAAGVTMATAKADNDVTVTADVDIFMTRGASIRTVKTDNDGYGIRFAGNVTKDTKTALENKYGTENVEYGVLICPADYLTDGVTLDFDESDNLKEYTTGAVGTGVKYFQRGPAAEFVEDEDAGVYQFRCSLVNLNANNLDREFAAAAYVGVRNSAEDAFTYTVSSTYSRNIYTVATYALQDTTANLGDEAKTYFENDVVGKVNETYTKTNVTLESDGEAVSVNKFSVGDTFTVHATVENTDGKKLEAGISLPNASSSVTKDKTKNNTYTVAAMGDLDLTASFVGFKENNTDLSGYVCDTKTIAANTLKGEWGTGKHEFDVSTDITHPESATVYKLSGKNGTLFFDKDDYYNWKVGTYIVIDIYGVDSPAMALNYQVASSDESNYTTFYLYDTVNSNPSGTHTNSIVNKDLVKWTTYNMDGTVAAKSMQADAWDRKWVRLQIELLRDASEYTTRFGFQFFDNEWHSFAKGLYVSNIQVRTYSEGYTEVKLSNFDSSKTYDFGEQVSLSAQAKTNRGIWKDVTANCTIASGNGTVVDNTFNVGLGDATLNFSFAGERKTVTVKGADHIDLMDSVVAKQENKAIITNEDSYTDSENVTRNDVLKYTVDNLVKLTDLEATQYGCNISRDKAQYMKKNMYLYIDFCVSKKTTFFITSGGNDAYAYSNPCSTFYQTYKEGTAINDTVWNGAYVNQWITLEYQLSKDWNSDGTYFYFGFTKNQSATDTATGDIYFANIEIREKVKDYSVLNLAADERGVLDLTDYAGMQDEKWMTLQEVGSTEIAAVNEMAQKTTVLEWKYSDAVVAGNGAIDSISFNTNQAGILLPKRYIKQDMYLYFDVYCTSYCSLAMMANSGKAVYCLMYGGCNQEAINNTDYEFQIYDSNGKAFTSGSFNGGDFKNQWVTVEFKIMKDWDNNDAITMWNYKEDNTTYLANIKLSNSKLMGANA